MQKKNVQGISRSKNSKPRSIREVERESRDQGNDRKEESDRDFDRPRGRRSSQPARWGMWFVLLVIIAFLFFLYTSVSAGVEVQVESRAEVVGVSGAYTAASTGAESGELSYEVMTVNGSAPVTVEASGQEYQETQARGEIRIYNSFSEEPQTLVATTRFESEEGLIYRTPEAVTVPGMEGNQPGTVVAQVVADEPGAEYNTASTEFTIPGFSDLPQFESIYADIATPIEGGFAGERPVVSEGDAESVQATVSDSLRARLLEQARAQKPDTFVLFDGAIFYDFGELVPAEEGSESTTEDGGITMQQNATARAIIFDRQQLGHYLAQEVGQLELGSDEVVTINPSENIIFTLQDPGEENISTADSVSFNLSGQAVLVWEVDYQKLTEDLSGKEKSDIDSVLTQHPGVAEAEITIRPFWQSSFPTDASEIEVISLSPSALDNSAGTQTQTDELDTDDQENIENEATTTNETATSDNAATSF